MTTESLLQQKLAELRQVQAGLQAGLTGEIQREIEEKGLGLPLAVDYHVEGEAPIPSRVVRLLRPHFLVEVGTSRRVVKVEYSGELVGSRKSRPKKYEPAFPRGFNPGVFGKDLQIVRVLAGLPANA